MVVKKLILNAISYTFLILVSLVSSLHWYMSLSVVETGALQNTVQLACIVGPNGQRIPGCIRQCLTGQPTLWRASGIVVALSANKKVSLRALWWKEIGDLFVLFMIPSEKAAHQEAQVPSTESSCTPQKTRPPPTAYRSAEAAWMRVRQRWSPPREATCCPTPRLSSAPAWICPQPGT